jgi:WD40 repeat protein
MPRSIATTGGDQDPLGGTVRIWDTDTGQARHTLTGHNGGVTALAVAPDGTWLATADNDYSGETVRIWSIDSCRCALSLRTGHRLRAVATNGRWVAVTGDRGPYFLTLTGFLTPDLR